MVIGGGPAGLEAARRARERGHEVSVHEKEACIGGQINLIAKRPKRHGMEAIIRYLGYRLEKLEVPIRLNREVTAAQVLEDGPEAVIVATGSIPIKKPVAGIYGPPQVLNVWEVLCEEYPVGERILFIDENGGHHAAATVELLADQGKEVTMVTSDLFIGMELAPLGDLYLGRQRLLQKGVTFISDMVVDAVEGTKVRARDVYQNKPVVFEGYDTIILDMGNETVDRLYGELKGKVGELYRVGDCVAPRGIDMAFIEGRKAAEGL